MSGHSLRAPASVTDKCRKTSALALGRKKVIPPRDARGLNANVVLRLPLLVLRTWVSDYIVKFANDLVLVLNMEVVFKGIKDTPTYAALFSAWLRQGPERLPCSPCGHR